MGLCMKHTIDFLDFERKETIGYLADEIQILDVSDIVTFVHCVHRIWLQSKWIDNAYKTCLEH